VVHAGYYLILFCYSGWCTLLVYCMFAFIAAVPWPSIGWLP
jgi:hypothetical protein